MSYVYYNPNPLKLSVGDCTIRAISCALNMSWKETYLNLLIQGYNKKYTHNSSIYSILTCLLGCRELTNYFQKAEIINYIISNKNNKPVSFSYLAFMDSLVLNNINDLNNSLYNLRNIKCQTYVQIVIRLKISVIIVHMVHLSLARASTLFVL